MPGKGSAPARAVHRRRHAAAEQLRRTLLGGDGWLEHPYFLELERVLARRPARIDPAAVDQAVLAADICYLGEFHAVRDHQDYAAELLERMVQRPGPLALGIEFVYTSQQHLLDQRQAGGLDDHQFLKRMHYREEWGYPWAGYAALLDRARTLGVGVHALDVPPRGGEGSLQARDDHAACRVAGLIGSDPGLRVLVLFGESHLARSHLPAAVNRRLRRVGLGRSSVTVFQDPDRPYWALAGADERPPRAATLGRDTFAVFHRTPLAKYEAYRQVLERWRGDALADDEVDLTPAVRHLILVLLEWLEIRPSRYRLAHPGGWAGTLEDAYPEVYSGPEAEELLEPVLHEFRRSGDDVLENVRLYRERGALYDPRSNSLFLRRYYPGRAAGEGARFLRAALTGRLFRTAETGTDPALGAYGAAYSEALAHLGTRLVDPASSSLAVGAGGNDPVSREWMAAHVRLEGGSRRVPPAAILEPLRVSRQQSRSLARDLGRRLGEQIYQSVRQGRIGSRELKGLFRRPFRPEQAPGRVLRLLRTTRI